MNLDLEIAKVDRDYESDPGESVVGSTRWTLKELVTHTAYDLAVDQPVESFEKVRFRLLDDDGNIYYGGWLFNDDSCAVQIMVLEWGKYYAGCTDIQVKLNGEWRLEIG
jgi:hypothetical protein